MSISQNLKNIYNQITVRAPHGPLSILYGCFLAAIWQIYKRTIRLPVLIRTYKGTYFLLRPDCVTSSRFVYEGRPDEFYVTILASFADEGTFFVDVGGNVGLYTVLLCNDFTKGWLFEPNPVAARMARHNLAINDVGNRFKVIEAAAGSKNGTVKFPILDRPLTTAHVGKIQEDEMMDVSEVRLDLFLPWNRSYVVKVDVEGADVEVLTGLYDLLFSGCIKICLFECQTDNIFRRVQCLVNELDYTIMDGERRLDQKRENQENRSRDLFLVRDDLLSHYLRIAASS